MPYTASYFVRGKFLGQSQFDCPSPPRQHAFFCATCGDIWGRIAVDSGTSWDIEHVPCEQHRPVGVQDWSAVPGSFLPRSLFSKREMSVMFWARAVEHLPPEVLKREFDITLQWFEKENDNAS